jgi:hypothetical protein
MKLRILDDSVRLRLSQTEVEHIARGEAVRSHARFPDGCFLVYGLEPSAETTIGATYRDNEIKVCVPTETARTWATSEQVTLSATVAIEGGELAILVEKDAANPKTG